jgi:molecular chaperone HtpG
MDGQLDAHLINHLESKFKDSRFVRVDSDVVDKLILKEDRKEVDLTTTQKDDLRTLFEGSSPEKSNYWVQFEDLGEDALPVVITRSEFMRRMKDMAAMSGTAGYYGNMPETMNLIVNVSHPLVKKVMNETEATIGSKINEFNAQIDPLRQRLDELNKANAKKKEDEIPQLERDEQTDLEKKIDEINEVKKEAIKSLSKELPLVKQLIDLALLANNMLKGEDLSQFVKRSIKLLNEDKKKTKATKKAE